MQNGKVKQIGKAYLLEGKLLLIGDKWVELIILISSQWISFSWWQINGLGHLNNQSTEWIFIFCQQEKVPGFYCT